MNEPSELHGVSVETLSDNLGLTRDEFLQFRAILRRNMDASDSAVSAVGKTFHYARNVLDSETNMADVWRDVLYRNYVDLYDGPVKSGKQSWRTVSGRAFEKIIVEIINGCASSHIRAKRIEDEKESQIAAKLGISLSSGGSGKLDVAIYNKEKLSGIVTTKTSFHGRLQHNVDDIKAVVNAGLITPLVTLDADGSMETAGATGEIREGRKEWTLVTEAGVFTNLYSFNNRTPESSMLTESGYRVFTDSPNLELPRFVRYIESELH